MLWTIGLDWTIALIYTTYTIPNLLYKMGTSAFNTRMSNGFVPSDNEPLPDLDINTYFPGDQHSALDCIAFV